MRRVVDLLGSTVLVTVVFVALLVLRPFGRELAVHLYLLAVAAIVLAGTVSGIGGGARRPRRSAFDEALHRRPAAEERPPQLERVERAVVLGVSSAFDFHARLRPVLREVATARLARFRGVELDSDAGRAAVGEDAWELLGPDRPPPDDRYASGVDARRLRDLVDMLETLQP